MHLTNAELWAAALGYALPPVIAIVVQPRWSGPVKGIFMLLVAVADGAGTAYFNDDFAGKPITTGILTAAVAIGLAYHTLWRPSGIAPRIEAATSTQTGTPAAPGTP
ncbi:MULTISPECIES: hypothetical protein [Streptomyces]|uniref:Uncharacterized protein n=1 Tax=Streptomyces doudnae TaxID=3075536 RepID=A0ABD5ELS1_9ACTN|nr:MULTISPECIES: hypothetical protein [unclassified Streptomyces]MDT0435596.1 hypothetical protein [Streptomyces sp. DSM 41981]MYQ62551.1 hypothetical protein [Streptomyces sp. SID4950]SCD39811.1 hypothetical protein GA0115242_104855 [Streptomyces sp. SolWspMP-5a-2]